MTLDRAEWEIMLKETKGLIDSRVTRIITIIIITTILTVQNTWCCRKGNINK